MLKIGEIFLLILLREKLVHGNQIGSGGVLSEKLDLHLRDNPILPEIAVRQIDDRFLRPFENPTVHRLLVRDIRHLGGKSLESWVFVLSVVDIFRNLEQTFDKLVERGLVVMNLSHLDLFPVPGVGVGVD
jgi:hypothetical protein